MLVLRIYLVTPVAYHVHLQVLYANAHPSMAHTSPEFIPVFGDCLRMIRDVLYTEDAQPFLISGSGTLGWDQVRCRGRRYHRDSSMPSRSLRTWSNQVKMLWC